MSTTPVILEGRKDWIMDAFTVCNIALFIMWSLMLLWSWNCLTDSSGYLVFHGFKDKPYNIYTHDLDKPHLKVATEHLSH